MMERQRILNRFSLSLLVIAAFAVAPALGSTLEIKEMAFAFEDLPYYSSQTLGFSAGTSVNSDVAIATGVGTVDYAYRIEGATVTLSNIILSSPFGTSGTFAGPATLSVTGRLVEKATATDLTGMVTLFTASMTSPSLVMAAYDAQFAYGLALFATDGGALFDGVTNGDDTIFLKDFGMGLWGSGATVYFGTNSMTPDDAGVQISTDAIPEPATIGLLALGCLSLLRKRTTV